MKIGVCSFAIGEEYKSKVKLCTDSLFRYCRYRNYDFINEEPILNNLRTIPWGKIDILLKYLSDEYNYDYLVWIDADIMIMNTTYKLEDFINNYMKENNFMVCTDSGNQLNTGVFFIKVNSYTKKVIRAIYDFPEIETRFHEQGPFNDFYNKNIFDLKNNTKVFDEYFQRVFNSTLSSYYEGDFLIHFLGISNIDVLEEYSIVFYPYKMNNESDISFTKRIENVKNRSVNYRYYTNKPMINICVCTEYTESDKYTYCKKSLELYCNRHNYVLKYIPSGEDKYKYIYDKTKDNVNFDYIIWINLDILICNYNITLENIINTYMNDKSILISKSIFGNVNSSIIFFKNNLYTCNLLELLTNYIYKLDNDLVSIFSNNMFNINDNSVILDSDNQHILNCCIGLYKYGFFAIQFFCYSEEGLYNASKDLYPYQKTNESELDFKFRIEWIKTAF